MEDMVKRLDIYLNKVLKDNTSKKGDNATYKEIIAEYFPEILKNITDLGVHPFLVRIINEKSRPRNSRKAEKMRY